MCMEDRTVYRLTNYSARHGKEQPLAGNKLNKIQTKKLEKSEHKRARRMC